MEYSNDERYDNVLLDIIQYAEKLPNFLDIIFGFLRRRTDLYHILTNDQQKIGFNPGDAEKLILKAFQKHKSIFDSTNSSTDVKRNSSAVTKNVCNILDNGIISNNKEVKVIAEITPQQNEIEKSHEGQTVSDSYVQDSDCYNGAVRDNYSWSQTIEEIDVRVKIPAHIRTSKEVKVHTDKKYLKVMVKSVVDDTFNTTLEGNLPWDVRKNDVIWSYDPSANILLIALEKVQERWWDSFFIGEATIDTRAIDCSRPMSDLDDEAQAKIHKLMYDNQQKQLGLPTSDQQKVNDTLRAAWNAEGSPFKGTSYDPSSIDIVGNTTTM